MGRIFLGKFSSQYPEQIEQKYTTQRVNQAISGTVMST
jgi:hypothetical protein